MRSALSLIGLLVIGSIFFFLPIQIGVAQENLAENLQKVENRLYQIENRIGDLEKLLQGIENQLAHLEKLLGSSIGSIENSLAGLDQRITGLENLLERFKVEPALGFPLRAWIGVDGEEYELGPEPVRVGSETIARIRVTDQAGNPISGGVVQILIPEEVFMRLPPLTAWILMRLFPSMNLGSPIENGFAFVPILAEFEGERLEGWIEAPYYQRLEFELQVGAPPAPPEIGFAFDAPLELGVPNVVRALADGELVEGDLRIDDPDAPDPRYQIQEGRNPLSFVPGSRDFLVKFLKDGRVLASDTFYIHPPPRKPFPWGSVLGILVLLGLGYGLYRYRHVFRKIPTKKIKEKAKVKGKEVEIPS